MKKLLFFLLIVIASKSQGQVNADCISSIPLCSTPNFTFFATSGFGSVNDLPSGNNISNPSTNPGSANSGCLLSGELKPQWLLITIGNPGNLEFVFGATGSANPQAGYYDWAMWPYSPATCAGIIGNTLPPIRCNWNATSTGGTGMASAGNIPAGGNPGNYEPPLAVNSCQQFIICISNYSGVNTLVSFQSLGTASLSCSPNCNPNYTICAGASATITPVNFAALTSPVYSLNPGGLTSTTGSFVVNPTTTTTYSTYITGLNTVGAVTTITATSTVTVNPLPVLAPTFTQVTCTNTLNSVNLNLTFNPGSASPTYTVLWSPTPSTVSASQTVGTGLSPGITNVTVTAAGGCSTTSTFTMTTVSPPTFTLTNNTGSFSLTCTNPTINLCATTNYVGTSNFFWLNNTSSFSSSLSCINLTNGNTGTYTVSLTDPTTGCSTSQTFAIGQSTVAPSNTVNPASQVITCNAGCATFTNTISQPTTNVTTYWYGPGSTYTTGPTLVNSGTVSIYPGCTPGTHTLLTINNVNGCSTVKTITVTSVSAFPTFNATSTTNFTLGCGSPVNTTTLCMANATSTNGPVQYAFMAPGNTATVPLSASLFGASSCTTTGIPGTWTLVVLDPVSGCQTPLPVVLLSNTVLPNVSASMLTQTLTCNNPTVDAVGNSTTPNTNVSWLIPAPPNSLPTPSIVIGTPTGPNTNTALPNAYAIYTVVATNTVSQCKSTQTVQIYQNFSPPRNIGLGVSSPSFITCQNSCVTISFTNALLSTSVSIPSNTWTTPPPVFNTSTLSSINACSVGSYSIAIKDSQNGCVTNTLITILDQTNKPVLAALPLFTLDCAATTSLTSTKITVALTSSLSSWSLYFTNYPPGTTFSNIQLTTPPNGMTVTPAGSSTSTLLVDKPGDYRFVVKNLSTGCSDIGLFTVANGGLNADFSPSTITGFAPLNVNFNNLSSSSNTATGTSSITTQWSFGNGSVQTTTSTAIGTSAIYNNPGTYTVTIVSKKGSCVDSAYKVIRVDIPSKLEIPNVFTPNGDGSNDVFFLKTSNLSEITALIFDRWGNKVYDLTSSTGNIAWDGLNPAGKECASGTYFYIIKATGKDGQTYEKKGNVSLYR